MTSVTMPLPQHPVFKWIALDQIQHEVLRSAAAYWTSLRGSRPWPAREELNFRDMASFLPHMSLVRVIDDGADFEHRFVGDSMVQAFHVPVQFRRFSEIAADAPKMVEAAFTAFRKVLETRSPIAWQQHIGHAVNYMVYIDGEIVLFPLGRTDLSIDHILAVGMHEAHVAG
jgi:hypothetical protein